MTSHAVAFDVPAFFTWRKGTVMDSTAEEAVDSAAAAMTRIVRRDTAEGGEVSEIASVGSGARTLLTAVRDGSGALKLIQWLVEDDGGIRRMSDSGTAAGIASNIDIARGRLIVTACRSGSGNLVLMSWAADLTSIVRRGDSRASDGRDLGGEADLIQIVALSNDLFVTAVRSAAGNLVLITWSLNAQDELIRVDDSHGQVGEVTEISLVRAGRDAQRNHRVVTAVRAGDGSLVMISWSIRADGRDIRRMSFNHEQAGGAREIRSVFVASDRIVTSVRADNDDLVLIAWQLEANGSLTRLADSHGQAGQISANALILRGGGVLSAVRAGDQTLRLIQWQMSPRGALTRIADSAAQTGEVGLVTLPRGFEDRAPIITVVTTPRRQLRLISWLDGA